MPTAWGDIYIKKIHKKGELTDPANYRSIALMSTIVKIFIDILNLRLLDWARMVKALPEFQVGFRPERSCQDNISTLYAMIQIQLSKYKGKLLPFLLISLVLLTMSITVYCLRSCFR